MQLLTTFERSSFYIESLRETLLEEARSRCKYALPELSPSEMYALMPTRQGATPVPASGVVGHLLGPVSPIFQLLGHC